MQETCSICSNLIVAKLIPNGYTWTLASRLGEMLTLAQREYGERDASYTFLGIEFKDGTPKTWYPGDCKQVIIQLGTICMVEPMRAYYQLAHEAIHLLSPTGTPGAICLEEGLATHFSEQYMAKVMNAPYWHSGVLSYEKAKDAVKMLLDLRPEIIRELRTVQPKIDYITSDMILSKCPEIGRDRAEYLASPFEQS